MADLIDRQAAIVALRDMAVPLYKDPGCEDIWERDRTLDNAIDVIRELPSAQPEQKFGKWIVMDDDRISGRCSVCGWEAHMYEDDVVGMDYCPNCGAKMEEQDDRQRKSHC